MCVCFCIGVSIVQLEQINVSCIGCRCTNKGEKDWFAVFEFFFSINHSFTSNVYDLILDFSAFFQTLILNKKNSSRCSEK